MNQPASHEPGEGFHEVAESVLACLGPTALRQLADRIEAGQLPDLILHSLGTQDAAAVARVLATKATAQIPDPLAAAYLHGLAAGYARQEARCEVELVWSGPTTHLVPVRATEQVLLSLIASATRELMLMTYSATPHPPVLDALAEATARAVATTVVGRGNPAGRRQRAERARTRRRLRRDPRP